MNAVLSPVTGARVVIRSGPAGGLCGLALAVPAGRGTDPPGRAGLAHLVEHLVLKPDRMPVDDFVVNAFTTNDLTLFETVCSPGAVSLAAARLLSVLDELRVDEATLDLERRIIDVEAGGHDQPHSPLGPHAERAAITPEDVAAFHEFHYRAGNATLAVVGEHFTDHPAAEGPPAENRGERVRLLHRTASGRGISLRMVVPPCGSTGYAAAAVAYAGLVGPGPQPYQLAAQTHNRRFRGRFDVRGQLHPGRTGSVLSIGVDALGTGDPVAGLTEVGRTADLEAARDGLVTALAVLRQDPQLAARAEASWAASRPDGLAGLAGSIASVPRYAAREIVDRVLEAVDAGV